MVTRSRDRRAGRGCEVVDDGVGFTQDERDASRAEGHVGLSLLEELAARMGGTPRGAIDARARDDVRAGGAGRMIRVVIADDHAVVRAGLAQLLATFADVELVGEAANGDEAVALSAEREPDVVLMDLEMPVLDGIEATQADPAAQPDVAVVVLTSFSDRERILQRARRRRGRVPAQGRGARRARRARSSRRPRRGAARPEGRTRAPERAASGRPAEGLSDREREVLALVARGLPNKLIARRLGISEKTVKAHLTSVFRQIGVTDRTQAALWAQRHGVTRTES